MDKSETIKAFNGYGSGNQAGEYYYSQGFRKSLFGVVPGWLVTSKADSATFANLGAGTFLSQVNLTGGTKVFHVGANGTIFSNAIGTDTWEQAHENSKTSIGNGLLCDGNNRLLYASNQYLGMYDGSTWDDDFKDFGASLADYRPGDVYEDWALFGNDNKVAGLNVTDDSWNTNLFNMPTGYRLRAIKTGRNGVLLGFNLGSRAALVLWTPGNTRSIAPWIPLNSNVQSIALDPNTGDWIVTTQHHVVYTNGYTMQEYPDVPDFTLDSTIFSVKPQGTTIVGTKLVIANTGSTNYNRRKPGIWIMDTKTGLFEYAPVANGVRANVTMGAILLDSNNRLHVSYATDAPAYKYIGVLSQGTPAKASLILGPFGGNTDKKTADRVVFDLAPESAYQYSYPISFKATLKVYTFGRQLWSYALESGASPAKDILAVAGNASGRNNAQVGDEVTILEGVNAGEVRHIKTITDANTVNETWTLDTALPDYVEDGVSISIQPWKPVHTYTFTNITDLKSLEYSIKNKLQGRKYLLKLLLENMGTHAGPELHEVSFIYDDQGA